jgi:hypothetical protein
MPYPSLYEFHIAISEADRNHTAWKSAGNEEDFKEALLQYLRALALKPNR